VLKNIVVFGTSILIAENPSFVSMTVALPNLLKVEQRQVTF